jgi:hypothetical protein
MHTDNVDTGNRIASEILMAGGQHAGLNNRNITYAISLFESYVVVNFNRSHNPDNRYSLQMKLFRQPELSTSDPADMLKYWQLWLSTIRQEIVKHPELRFGIKEYVELPLREEE